MPVSDAMKIVPLLAVAIYVFRSRCPDSRNAIHRVASYSSQTVSSAITIGTPMNAPEMPQRKLQKNMDSKTI